VQWGPCHKFDQALALNAILRPPRGASRRELACMTDWWQAKMAQTTAMVMAVEMG